MKWREKHFPAVFDTCSSVPELDSSGCERSEGASLWMVHDIQGLRTKETGGVRVQFPGDRGRE